MSSVSASENSVNLLLSDVVCVDESARCCLDVLVLGGDNENSTDGWDAGTSAIDSLTRLTNVNIHNILPMDCLPRF